jgi:hypothetical protein
MLSVQVLKILEKGVGTQITYKTLPFHWNNLHSKPQLGVKTGLKETAAFLVIVLIEITSIVVIFGVWDTKSVLKMEISLRKLLWLSWS